MSSSSSCIGMNLEVKECTGGSTFNLEKAVCNHGFFMMSPNEWIPSTKTLKRPLTLSDSTTSVIVSVSQTKNTSTNSLLIRVHNHQYHLSCADQQTILEQVYRMLRLSKKDERDVTEFQKVCSEAKEKGFGRIFRSPTLFEDVVKSILLCNSTFERSLEMASALCLFRCEKNKKAQRKRKRSLANNNVDDDGVVRNFPSSKVIANSSKDYLDKKCNLGYRTEQIIKLAKKVESGGLNLSMLEALSCETEVYAKLMKVKGLGPFACTSILMCMGFYQRVPIDSETIRHLKKVHGRREDCRKPKAWQPIVKEIYGKYAPFQCLAYWFELWKYYESLFGSLSELPSSEYHIVSGSRKTLLEPNDI